MSTSNNIPVALSKYQHVYAAVQQLILTHGYTSAHIDSRPCGSTKKDKYHDIHVSLVPTPYRSLKYKNLRSDTHPKPITNSIIRVFIELSMCNLYKVIYACDCELVEYEWTCTPRCPGTALVYQGPKRVDDVCEFHQGG